MRLTATVLMLSALAGCAIQGGPRGEGEARNIATMRGGNPAGPELSQFLEQATPGSAIRLQQSLWGASAEVVVAARYYAASGRPCLRLNVALQRVSTGLTENRLACRVEGQGWFTQRLVTDALESSGRE